MAIDMICCSSENLEPKSKLFAICWTLSPACHQSFTDSSKSFVIIIVLKLKLFWFLASVVIYSCVISSPLFVLSSKKILRQNVNTKLTGNDMLCW